MQEIKISIAETEKSQVFNLAEDSENIFAMNFLIAAKYPVILKTSDGISYRAQTLAQAMLYLSAVLLSDKDLLQQIRGRKLRMEFASEIMYFISEELGEDIELNALEAAGISTETILEQEFSMEDMIQKIELSDIQLALVEHGTEQEHIFDLCENVQLLVFYRVMEDGEVVIEGIHTFVATTGMCMKQVALTQAMQVYLGLMLPEEC